VNPEHAERIATIETEQNGKLFAECGAPMARYGAKDGCYIRACRKIEDGHRARSRVASSNTMLGPCAAQHAADEALVPPRVQIRIGRADAAVNDTFATAG